MEYTQWVKIYVYILLTTTAFKVLILVVMEYTQWVTAFTMTNQILP